MKRLKKDGLNPLDLIALRDMVTDTFPGGDWRLLAASMRSAMRDCTDYPAVSEALFLYRASAGGES